MPSCLAIAVGRCLQGVTALVTTNGHCGVINIGMAINLSDIRLHLCLLIRG
jgi:hypothetical protein